MVTHGRIVVPRSRYATFETFEPNDAPLGEHEIAGPTVASLLSAGTEIALYRLERTEPFYPGYCCVFRVERVGSAVTDVAPGDYVYAMAPHQSYQRLPRKEALKVPEGLAPKIAVFARMANMAMTAIATTAARPPQLAFVNGLGLIGQMTAQVCRLTGYEVAAADPSEERRAIARSFGFERMYDRIPVDDPAVAGRVSLFLDCGGKEQDVIDGCRTVHPNGEVVLIGVPWTQRSEHTAHELISLVFHRYVRLRSGWEWEIPLHAEREGQPSVMGSKAAALRWLAEGRLRVDDLYETADPRDAEAVYRRIDMREREKIATVFDWRSAES